MDTTDLIETLMDTRSFCGNEMQALWDWEAENKRLTPLERKQALALFEATWAKAQHEAGIALPLSAQERAKAYRDINSGR